MINDGTFMKSNVLGSFNIEILREIYKTKRFGAENMDANNIKLTKI